MPAAIASIDTVRHELKSLEGAFVELKPMSYGQSLVRSDMMMQMRMEASKGSTSAQMDVTMMNEKVAVFDFANCIVNHNLEDNDGNTLDLKSPPAVKALSSRVGQEIGDLINKMNQFEDELGK